MRLLKGFDYPYRMTISVDLEQYDYPNVSKITLGKKGKIEHYGTRINHPRILACGMGCKMRLQGHGIARVHSQNIWYCYKLLICKGVH